MITRKYFEDLITNSGIPHNLVFTAKTNSKDKFKALNFYHLKQRLSDEEIDYYCENYEEIKKLITIGNLSSHRLAKYIHFFFKKNIDLNKVIFNKKIKITEEICRQKIINTLKYDFDSFSIKIGNISLNCFKEEEGVYKVLKYVGKNHKNESKKYESFQEIYTLYFKNLGLLEVTW